MQITFGTMKSDDSRLFGERVKQRRLELKKTQEWLADHAGVKRASISQWETGETKKVNADNLLRAAQALDCSPEWLLFGTESKQLMVPPSIAPMYLDWQVLTPRQRQDIIRQITEMAAMNREILEMQK